MANQNLIQAQAKVSGSQGFVDHGAKFNEGIQKWEEQAQTRIKVRQEKLDQANALVADYMDKIPDGKGLEKIPTYAKEKVASFLASSRDEYAKHAKSLRDLDPNSPEYQEHVKGMNYINNSFVRLNDQFTSLLENKVGFLQLSDNQELSRANKPGDIDFLSNIYTDATDMSFDKNGNILFNNNGSSVAIDELPKYHAQETEIPGLIMKQMASLQKNATKWTPAVEELTRKQIRVLVKKNGMNGIRSLAADDTIGNDDGLGLGISDELLNDPSRIEELTEVVVENYIQAMKEVAESAYDAKQSDYWSKHQPKPGKKDNAVNAAFGLDDYGNEIIPIKPEDQ